MRLQALSEQGYLTEDMRLADQQDQKEKSEGNEGGIKK